MEIEKEFLSKQHTILAISSGDYNTEIVKNLKQLSGKSICYVTLNKTHQALEEIFAENKIDKENIIIIDAISKTIETTPEIEKNCYFVSSPGALTELSIAIRKFLDYGF
jgi:archaellum biogenesis ATPase FlaH